MIEPDLTEFDRATFTPSWDLRLAMLDRFIVEVGKVSEQSALALHDRISKLTDAACEVAVEHNKRITALEARIAALESENAKRT